MSYNQYQLILPFKYDEFHPSALALHVPLFLGSFINHLRRMVADLSVSDACSGFLRPAHAIIICTCDILLAMKKINISRAVKFLI
jgi:hypothetical protein